MSCLEAHRQLQLFLDGAAPDARAALAAHLAVCPACRELYAAAELLQKGIRSTPAIVPPPGMAERIVGEVLERRQIRLRRRRLAAVAALAAAVLLMVWGGVQWFKGWQNEPADQRVVQRPDEPARSRDPVGRGDLADLSAPARSLAKAGQSLSVALEPVASSARRAVDVIMREIEPTEAAEKGGS